MTDAQSNVGGTQLEETWPREEREELYHKATLRWTNEVQWIKAAEEFAELAATLNRALNEQADLEDVLDEMADAQIMLEQLQTDFRDEKVDEAVAKKLDRLEGMLSYEE